MQTVTAAMRKKTARKHAKIGMMIPASIYGGTESAAKPFTESGPKVTVKKHQLHKYSAFKQKL